jgi:hypothetical protein
MCDMAYILQTVGATMRGLVRLSLTAQEPSPVHWYRLLSLLFMYGWRLMLETILENHETVITAK